MTQPTEAEGLSRKDASDKGRAILEKEDRATRKPGPKVGNTRVTNVTLPPKQKVAEGRRAPLADVPPEIENGVDHVVRADTHERVRAELRRRDFGLRFQWRDEPPTAARDDDDDYTARLARILAALKGDRP